MYYQDTTVDTQTTGLFVPFLSANEDCQPLEIDIDFELMVYNNELLWAQKTESIITYLDPDCGTELLKIMNDAYCINAVKILNKIGNILYPKKEKAD